MRVARPHGLLAGLMPSAACRQITGAQSRRLLHDLSVQQYPEALRLNYKRRTASLAAGDDGSTESTLTLLATEKKSVLGRQIAIYDDEI